MKRFFFLGFLIAASAAAQSELTELARRVSPSVVLLERFDPGGRMEGSGTGFFVSTDGVVVTNHHVIAGAGFIEAVTADNERFEVLGVLAADPVRDLAILKVETAATPALTLDRGTMAEAGERVIVVGSPLGLAGSLSEGIVSAIRTGDQIAGHNEDDAKNILLQITAAISHGSSGSPVMNLDGEVVGVAASGYVSGQNLNFAIPVADVRRLLDGIDTSAPLEPFTGRMTLGSPDYLRNLGISVVVLTVFAFLFRRLTRKGS